jgi:Putative Actinobacterial Holin-X, holin superfamily III
VSDRRNGVPTTVTSIPLVDPHAPKADPSIGDLVKDATAQVSTLVRAEVELAKAEITRDVKKGLTGSVFFILALVVLFYSTFFFFFFLGELLDLWLVKWAAYLIVFGLMVVVTGLFAFLGYLKVRRIRGPQKTIESVREIPEALTPGHAKALEATDGGKPASTADPSGW